VKYMDLRTLIESLTMAVERGYLTTEEASVVVHSQVGLPVAQPVVEPTPEAPVEVPTEEVPAEQPVA
jgi:hypothetical protein